MSVLIINQRAFFRIDTLTETALLYTNDSKDEVFGLYLLLNGEVEIQAGGSRVLVGPNSLYCNDLNENRRVSIKAGAKGYAIHFNRALLCGTNADFNFAWFSVFHSRSLAEKAVQIGDTFLQEGNRLCEMMLQEFRREHHLRMEILGAFLNVFLLYLLRCLGDSFFNIFQSPRFSLLHKFNLLLEQHYKTNKKVADYAALLCISPNYLNNTIKQETGKSVSTLIRQRIVMEAVKKAKLSGASLKEVADDLGFQDKSHFSKYFKKVAGKNFREVTRETT
ncbi:helix-turn-helix transcriptional regulator [Paraflavitalea sp. CAU 1676]|uniref:AraC family transcriptional regulator n=1 Tax=Paraflavitalea sp. CAU 1676 TaxID=3032598 RepID=UPI0023DC170B|nr:helix-turn-helix transcriptional regulator [Paraflavitalea sp. CAU 1676]MDF2187917.1 helix-turn-helix transcriptional regulator [Paraflavitalea sp. CAU 1676]